jgi:hypothetical protein
MTSKDGKARAFVVANGRLEERLLHLGPNKGAMAGVLKGVAAGETVATGDLSALINGQPVQ